MMSEQECKDLMEYYKCEWQKYTFLAQRTNELQEHMLLSANGAQCLGGYEAMKAVLQID